MAIQACSWVESSTTDPRGYDSSAGWSACIEKTCSGWPVLSRPPPAAALLLTMMLVTALEDAICRQSDCAPQALPEGMTTNARQDAARLGLGVLPSLIGFAALMAPSVGFYFAQTQCAMTLVQSSNGTARTPIYTTEGKQKRNCVCGS